MANHVEITTTVQSETVESMTKDLTSSILPVVDYLTAMTESLMRQALSYEGIVQFIFLAVAFVFARVLSISLKRTITSHWPSGDREQLFMESLLRAVQRVVLPLFWVVPLWLAVPVLREIQIGNDIIRSATSILQAWIVIDLFSSIVRDAFWPGLLQPPRGWQPRFIFCVC